MKIAPPHCYIVGAGHCGQAIAHLAHMLGCGVTVIDDRPLARFPLGTVREVERDAATVFAEVQWRPQDSVILVSRSYDIDREALRAILETEHEGYIGMIGSKKKVKRVYDELAAAGMPRSAFERVCAPIGLEIGAETPEEIAVSVMAEVLQRTKLG